MNLKYPDLIAVFVKYSYTYMSVIKGCRHVPFLWSIIKLIIDSYSSEFLLDEVALKLLKSL